ncbi:MAG: hypothetical protein RLZZ74_2651, partial [Cyanobacteriota bacterium]
SQFRLRVFSSTLKSLTSEFKEVKGEDMEKCKEYH